jgi:hypothetical protein
MQKAFYFNMDKEKYGTIAEIGAGQEVSRFFFRAGGAAGTIAKTISAYDMDFSDAIYGKEEDKRYVTEKRLKKMLDKEFRLVLERVGEKRPRNSTYFAFADTITAKSYSQQGESHGWMGIKLQLYPRASASEILLHVRMLDESNLMQQEAVGILGVNLIYGAFHHYADVQKLIRSLGDNLEWGRLEIDLIRFTGPYFNDVDNRLMALKLVEMELSDAVVFASDRKTLVHPSELFYKREVLILRSMFKPVTNVSIDMMDGGMDMFLRTTGVNVKTAMAIPEISIAEMRKLGKIDMQDILGRVDCLNLLHYPVIVTNYLRFFRVRAYLGRYTKGNVAFVLGIPNLTTLFDTDYYEGLKGGLLGAFASLFDRETLLFVYPMRSKINSEQIITAKTFPVPEPVKFFYYYLLANQKILPVEKYNVDNMYIWPEDIRRQIKKGRGEWETCIPEVVTEEIIRRRLFGFGSC